MTALTFDSLKYTKTLEEAGVPRKQAEAQAVAQREAFVEFTANNVSREELVNAKSELTKSTDKKFEAVKDAIKELDVKIEASKSEILKWMFSGFFALASLMIGILLK